MPATLMSPSKFRVGDVLRHENGQLYTVWEVPEHAYLEATRTPCYIYRLAGGNLTWARCKEEMEDGRFTFVKHSFLVALRLQIGALLEYIGV